MAVISSDTPSKPKNKGGRPHGSLAEPARLRLVMKQKLLERAEKEIKPLLDALFESAKGAYYTKEIDGKECIVYKREPDVAAIRELADRIWGKPAIVGDDGAEQGPLQIVVQNFSKQP